MSFGEQPSAAKWNILGTNDAYFDAQIGSGTAWTSFSPTLANVTVGNGTTVAKYQQFGKTVIARISFVLGNTSAIGSGPTTTLPVTSATYTAFQPIGDFIALDAGNSAYPGTLLWATTTTAGFYVNAASTAYDVSTSLAAAVPFAFGTSDALLATLVYEAA